MKLYEYKTVIKILHQLNRINRMIYWDAAGYFVAKRMKIDLPWLTNRIRLMCYFGLRQEMERDPQMADFGMIQWLGICGAINIPH